MEHSRTFLAMTSPPNSMTQMRFCLKEIHIWKETGESTLALHQIKSELPLGVCVSVCKCVWSLEPGSWSDWVTGAAAYADCRASVSVYDNAPQRRRHSICDHKEKRQSGRPTPSFTLCVTSQCTAGPFILMRDIIFHISAICRITVN